MHFLSHRRLRTVFLLGLIPIGVLTIYVTLKQNKISSVKFHLKNVPHLHNDGSDTAAEDSLSLKLQDDLLLVLSNRLSMAVNKTKVLSEQNADVILTKSGFHTTYTKEAHLVPESHPSRNINQSKLQPTRSFLHLMEPSTKQAVTIPAQLQELTRTISVVKTPNKTRSPLATTTKSTPKSTNLQLQIAEISTISRSTPKRYRVDHQGYRRYREYLTRNENILPLQKRAVIILTNHRSGSSFFGELFNQHPDAFYVFEPLVPLSNSSQCQLHLNYKLDAIKSHVQCILPDWLQFYRRPDVRKQLKITGNVKDCLQRRMCFSYNTKEICEDRHCPRTYDKSVRNCKSDCGAVNPRAVNNECRKKSLVAIKTIRLCDIENLEEIMSKLHVDIKVIHLLRDPRGIANSRQLVIKNIDLKRSMTETCQRQAHNLAVGITDTPEWLKGRYMVFRYEDVALHPYEVAQSVYDYVGLDFPQIVKYWIEKNTKIPVPPVIEPIEGTEETESVALDSSEIAHRYRRATPNLAYMKRMQLKKKLARKRYNPYGTSRDSAKIVQKWTLRLPYSTVNMIDNTCEKIMKLAGYYKVSSNYTRDKTIKYFGDSIPILDDMLLI